MNQIVAKAAIILPAIVFAVVVGLILAFPVSWLWNNCLVDAVTWAKPIGWLQAWGLMILSSLLFKTSASVSK